jgi:acetate kinase
LIEALQRHYRDAASQVACFDTAFHTSLPDVAKILPVPQRFAETRVHRYGFHGLSYTYLLDELRRLDPHAAEHGRIVMAHLGGGASMAAVHKGQCIDTSMGFTPTGGLVMGTRSGDLDPGLLCYLLRRHGLSGRELEHAVNHEAGMLGVSGTSADVRDLLEREAHDPRARTALDLFCYQAKKFLGAYVAALGGLDALVFAGGVGENAAPMRARICDSLQCFGIEIDADRNGRHDGVISARDAKVSVRVIRTDEEAVIARLSGDMVGLN